MNAKKIRLATQSGSVYTFDQAEMTWRRMNTNRGHEEIIGLEGRHGGLLDEWFDPIVGERFVFYDRTAGRIRTTPVVRIEDIS